LNIKIKQSRGLAGLQVNRIVMWRWEQWGHS